MITGGDVEANRSQWTDRGIDDLARRIGNVEPLVPAVAVLKRDFENLTSAVKANTEVTKAVADQLEQVRLEPLKRIRTFKDQLVIAIVGALVGGGVGVLAVVIAHG